jgi:hypothetical protein
MPLLVRNVLLPAIPFHRGRVLLAIPPPVIRVPGSPFLRAIQAHLAVFRVRSNLLAVVFSAAPALAAGIGAHRLRRLIFGGLEDPLTVAASPFVHIPAVSAVVASCGTCGSSGRFRNCYSVGTASWPIGLSAPPPRRRRGCCLSRMLEGSNAGCPRFLSKAWHLFTTTKPAEMLSF